MSEVCWEASVSGTGNRAARWSWICGEQIRESTHFNELMPIEVGWGDNVGGVKCGCPT
jgi:hypothetical protein